jgi:hypothetical protein
MILENEKICYNPLVLCNKLFIPVKHKTNIKGIWQGDNGKVYFDNIQVKSIPILYRDYLSLLKRELFNNGELCIFYKNIYNEGIIEDERGDKTILKNQRIFKVNKLSISLIKDILGKYNGLTIYKNDNDYIIEVYY